MSSKKEEMNSVQRELWTPLNLEKRVSDPLKSSRLVDKHCMKLLSPEIRAKLDELIELAFKEIERLGGNVDQSKASIENMADNFYSTVVHSAIPEEVINAKCGGPM
jgi:hypothetical protein